MFCHASETFQMGLDALSPLGEGRWLLCGWVMHPRGAEARLQFHGADGRALPLLYEGRHRRPDVAAGAPGAVGLYGFHIVFAAGEEGRGALSLRAEAGGQELRARLGDPAIGDDLSRLLAARPWARTMALLADARRAGPLLAPLLAGGATPGGALAGWISALPPAGPEAAPLGPAAALALAASPAGDLGLALRPAAGRGPLRAETLRLEALARAPEGGLSALPLAEWRLESVGEALLGWGRVERPPGTALDLVLQAELGAEELWARSRAPARDLVALFDGLAAAALGPEPGPEARAALRRALGRLLARREAAACTALQAGLGAAGPAGGRPLLLLGGVEEELGLRLIEAAVPSLADAAPPLLLFGPAAGLAQLALEERGIEARAGEEAERALEEAGARPVRALSLRELAEAMIEERLDEALHGGAPGLPARDVLLLHRLAGPGPDPAATLARRAGREALPHTPACPDAAPPLAAHLEALWRALPARHSSGRPAHG
ncbi:hypothetical protein [Rubritepida flocculans]|uniref:hypothetical protein n=1 Tax=Rubritepida flocculans TaxID=182403 RepID=UPI0004182986|nr:hypothetical protein [Rubritepida flocculans]